MKIVNLACGGLLALIVAAACGGKSAQSGGSNTNWFSTCNATAECGSGLECWCGICTSPCTTECDRGPAAATCAMPPATCAEPSEKHACAIACTNDAACKSLGAGATCVGSICRKGTSSGEKLSCEERSAEAYNRVQALFETADRSCEDGADCLGYSGTSCTNHCLVGVVSLNGKLFLDRQSSAIEEEVCKPFEAAGCVVTEPPCEFPGTPACVSGKCELVIPGQGSGATCQERSNQANDRIGPALEAADRSCSSNADCTRIGPGLKCFGGCETYPVSKKGAADVQATRAAVDRDICDAYVADGCMPGVSSCPVIPSVPPQCVNGTCTNVFASSDGGAPTSCADRTARMRTDAEGAAQSADRACSTSADCQATMLVNQCLGGCTYVPTSLSGAQALESALSMMESRSCGDFSAAGCTVTRLPCVPPPPVSCKDGRCSIP